MIDNKKYIKLPKPEKLSDSRKELRKLDDNQWKQHIFFHILKFYKEIDNNQVIKLIEKEKLKPKKQIEEAIKKLIRKQLINDRKFSANEFIINREPASEHGGSYDFKIQHSSWRDKYFTFECKNLDTTSTSSITSSINEYVYNKSKPDGGVYRYIIGKYAKNLNFGGMIGFIIKGETDKIIKQIIEKLRQVSNNNVGKLTGKSIICNSIENNKNTFDSIHLIEKKFFTLHHIMMNFSA